MSASAPSPRLFGPYVLTRAIGSDPLGEVWRGGTAGAPRLHPFSFFRTFTSAAIDRAALLAAMETAVQLVDDVQGPAVARGTVLGVIDDIPFLAAEYVPGRTLGSLLGGRVLGAVLPAEHGLLIAERLLAALEAGAPVERSTGAPHGFLVPAFVSVANDGETRVFGYGLGAGLLPSLGVPRVREAFAPYIAPEVLVSGKPGTPGDLYSVGAILFEALTGTPPRAGVALEAVETSTLAIDGSPVPEDIRRLLRRALHPDPGMRDRDIASYRRDLSALFYGGPYAPSTFNLAFFLQKSFERAIQREEMEVAIEEELGPAAVAAAPRAAAVVPGVRKRTRVESSPGVWKPDAARPGRQVDSTTGSRPIPAAPPPTARPADSKVTAPVRTVSGPPKRTLGGVPVWAVGLGGAAVLAAGAFFSLRPSAQAPPLAPTDAPRPTAAPPTPLPTPAPVVVGKDDPLFQAAVQKMLDEELKKKQDARAAGQQVAATKKKQAEMDRAAEGARQARETDDAARAAREKADREEAGRIAREAATRRREEARAAAAPAPAVKQGDLVDVGACDTPPVSTSQVGPVVPQAARQQGVSGTVFLRVLVDETGKPEKIEVLRDVTPNVGLAEASREALEQWRWKPATKDGVSVKTWLTVQVPFKN